MGHRCARTSPSPPTLPRHRPGPARLQVRCHRHAHPQRAHRRPLRPGRGTGRLPRVVRRDVERPGWAPERRREPGHRRRRVPQRAGHPPQPGVRRAAGPDLRGRVLQRRPDGDPADHAAPELIAGAGLIGSNHRRSGQRPSRAAARPARPDAGAGHQRHPRPDRALPRWDREPVGFKPRGPVLSSLDSARQFARRNGHTDPPVVEQVTTGRMRTTLTRWRHDDLAPVDFYAITRGGHTVPNHDHRAPLVLGRTQRDLDAGDLVADFFGL